MNIQTRTNLPWRHRLTVRLTGGVILVLLLIGIPFLFAFHRLHRSQETASLEEATARFSRFVSDSLRTAMLAGEPHLLDETIRGFTGHSEIEKVMLLDHQGRVMVSSHPEDEGRPISRESEETCQVCHREAGETPGKHAVITHDAGKRVFRAMSSISNEPRCHGCHDPDQATNGILLVDYSLESSNRRFIADFGSTIALGAVMVVLTVVVLVILLRRMVHRPLRAIIDSSQMVVGGDLEARAPSAGEGEFSLLASGVNRMTDHLARSLTSLDDQRRELQAILDAVDDEIVVLDRKQRVVTANLAFRSQLPDPESDIDGHACRTLASSGAVCEGGEIDDCPVRKVFESGRVEKAIMSRNDERGDSRTLEIHASPLLNREGSLDLAVEVRRDISERRQMEAVLAHSEHMASLGLLASGLSHEINNPLGAISTSVEGLRRRVAGAPGLPPELGDVMIPTLRRIADQVDRGRAITGRLLRISRPPGLTRALVDVNHSVEEILALLSHNIRQSGVRTEARLSPGLPPLHGDESSMGQILMNLSLNAIQAMAESGGTLTVSTSLNDGTIRLRISDTGCGIPDEMKKRVFEPFYSTKPAGKGTGLGLFITHQIVSGMNGKISLESHEGPGTTVIVDLPPGISGKEA